MPNETDPSRPNARFLVIHPDAEMRQRVARALLRAIGTEVAVYEADYPTTAAALCRQYDPRAVFIDLVESKSLALEMVRSLKGLGYPVFGLYNPGMLQESEANLLKSCTRGGVDDFVVLPPSENDVRSAIDSLETRTSNGSSEHAGKNGRVVAFLGHKGGAGTSTLALNTAAALAARGQNEIALLDADLQFGDAAEMAGLGGSSGMLELLEQLTGNAPLEPFLQREPKTGLHILASPGSVLKAERIGPSQLSRILLALTRRFDTVVVDLPRTIDLNTLGVLDLAESIFLIIEPLPLAVPRARELVDLLVRQGYPVDRMNIILNRPNGSSGYVGKEEFSEALGFDAIALIPHDPKNMAAVNHDASLAIFRSKSPITQGLGPILRAILGGEKTLAPTR